MKLSSFFGLIHWEYIENEKISRKLEVISKENEMITLG